jgi:hypothetical protein
MAKHQFQPHQSFLIVFMAMITVFFCADIAAGGGGGPGESTSTKSGSFNGWRSDKVSAAFGYQGNTSGGTVNIGESAPPSTGAHQGAQWAGFNQVPSGLPQFSERSWTEARVAAGSEEARQEIEKAEFNQAGENLFQAVSIGCSIINGILSLGATTLTTEATKHIAVQITIYGLTYDGLTASVGAYTENRLNGQSASKSLANAASNGAAKVLSTVLLGKIGPAGKAANSVSTTIGGIVYDTLGSNEAAATNIAPAVPVVYAPVGTPTTAPSAIQNPL